MRYLSVVEWTAVVSNGLSSGAIAIPSQPPAQSLPLTSLIYIDRLYLASYTTPPSPDTLFPYPVQQSSRRSPSKRSARAADGPLAVTSDRNRIPPYYFSIDDSLLYNAFHHDFGPLHIG